MIAIKLNDNDPSFKQQCFRLDMLFSKYLLDKNLFSCCNESRVFFVTYYFFSMNLGLSSSKLGIKNYA